jgi:hypothetical protein
MADNRPSPLHRVPTAKEIRDRLIEIEAEKRALLKLLKVAESNPCPPEGDGRTSQPCANR